MAALCRKDYQTSEVKKPFFKKLSFKRYALPFLLGTSFLSPCVIATPPLEEERQALEQRIIQTTEAEEDVLSPALEALYAYLKENPDKNPKLLESLKPRKGSLIHKWEAFQPEIFLKHYYATEILKLSKGAGGEIENDFKNSPSLNAQHPYLKGILTLIHEMEALKNEEASQVARFYQDYIRCLITAEPQQRRKNLIEKSFLILENGKIYRLPHKKARDLIGRSLYWLSVDTQDHVNATHCVLSRNGVHYKFDGKSSLRPSFETALTLLGKLLQGNDAPLSPPSLLGMLSKMEIIRFKNNADFMAWHESIVEEKQAEPTEADYKEYFQKHGLPPRENEKPQDYCFFQAATTVKGMSLITPADEEERKKPDFKETLAFKEFPVENFDLKHFGRQVVLSLLTHPYDGKAENFILAEAKTGYQFVGIDNDCLFSSSVFEKEGAHYPGIWTLLYALPLMHEALPEDFIKDIQSLPSTLPWQYLGALFQQRQRYRTFSDLTNLPKEIQEEYELEFNLRPGTFVRMQKTWQKIQETLVSAKTTTFMDLVHEVDPLTGFIYECLSRDHQDPLEMYKSLCAQEQTLEGLFAKYPDKAQAAKAFFESNKPWPQGDKRGEGRSVSLEGSFLAGWQHPSIAEFSVADIMRLSRVLADLQTILPEGSWSGLVNDLKEHWPKEGLWRDEALPFKLFKQKGLTATIAALWCRDLLRNVSGQDEEGNTLLHILLRTLSSKAFASLDLKPLKRLMNVPNKGKATPLDLIASGWKPVTLLQQLLDLDAHLINDSQAMASYIQKKGRKQEQGIFVPWAHHLMNRIPQLRWNIMLQDFLPTPDCAEEGRSVESAYFKIRVVSSFAEQALFNKNGTFKKANTSGRRELGYIPWQGDHGLWFKIFPELPGREEVARQLCLESLVKGILPAPLIPPSTLLNIPCEGPWKVFKKKDLSCVSVLVSQSLGSRNFYKVLEEDPDCHKKLDSESLGWLFVLSLLLNPEDGKPDNYVVRPHPLKENKLILSSVDNDHILVPPVALEKRSGPFGLKKSRSLQVKTILYCLDQMHDRLDPALVKALLGMNASAVLQEWLEGIGAYDRSLGDLFNTKDRRALQAQESLIFVPFARGEMPELYRKFVRLQDVLAENPKRSFLEILMKVEPLLGKRYGQVLQEETLSPLERFKKIDGEFYSTAMKGSFQTLVTGRQTLEHFMGKIVTRKDFMTRTQNREDISVAQALEELQAYIKEEGQLLNLSEGAGYTGTESGLIETYLKQTPWEKIPQATQRHLVTHMIDKSFRELYLANCMRLSLKNFQTLGLHNLTFLDVSGCDFVDDTFLSHISRNCSVLNTLDMSGCVKLKNIGSHRRIISDFPCVLNSLTSLNLKKCASLEAIDLDAPHLAHLWAQGCNFLKVINLNAPKLICLWVNSCKKLKKLKLNSPLLNTLECKKTLIRDYDLYDILRDSPKLTLVNVTKCSQITNAGWGVLTAFFNDFGLTSLNLYNSKINDTAAKILAKNHTLTTLSLERNSVSDIGAQALAMNSTIRKLNLGYNDDIGLEGAVALAKNTTIQELSLKKFRMLGKGIGDSGAQALAQNRTITKLDLTDNQIGYVGAMALAQNTALVILKLGYNEIGDLGTIALAENSSITQLVLSQTKSIGTEGIKALSRNTTLKKLKLWCIPVSDVEAQLLSGSKSLINLNLWCNSLTISKRIGCVGAMALAQNTTIRELNLSGHSIKNDGAIALAKNSTITCLNLSDNKVKNEGRTQLALNRSLKKLKLGKSLFGSICEESIIAFSKNDTLTYLDLQSLSIDDDMVEILAGSTTLKSLQLGWNKIGDRGAEALAQNTTLVNLDLWQNKVSDKGAMILAQNTTLQNLYLRANNVSKDGASALAQYKHIHLAANLSDF